MTFGELFAGIGGFSLGLERAGMKCKWQVEIDPYATAVLRKHWPDVPKHDDVQTFPPQGDWGVDLICGGFPCQDISVAGKGAGLAGERSGLWNDFARIIRTVRPRWVVIENVPALTARGLGTVLGDLAEIGMDAEWHCIPACAVGAPHQRDRVWIIAVRHSDGKRSDMQRKPYSTNGRAVPQAARRQSARVSCESDVADTVSQRDAVRGNGSPCSQGVAGRDCDSGRSERDSGPRCPRRAGQGASDVANAEGISSGARLCQSEPQQNGHQLGDGCGHVPDADRAGRQQQRRPEQTRAEQPAAECGGWWSTEPDVGRVAHGVPSRVDRLRCLGNAVVPQVVEIIGRAILEAEARMTA